MVTKIVRSITHWSAGGGRASDTDKEHYHRITEFDGTIIKGDEDIKDNLVTSDGDYAAHILRLNTGSAGFAMAGMRGATESPFNAGASPINRKQFEAHCKMLAEFHQSYGIPITRKTCLTHAEVQPTLGVKQRGKWDFTRLPFDLTIRGAIPCGDYMRERALSYITGASFNTALGPRPTLLQGDRGAFVLDAQHILKGLNFFSGAIDGSFGPLTKSAVQAFQDYAGLISDGVVGPSTWAALMKEEPKPERETTTDDLRDRGSRTIEAADKAEVATKRAGMGLVALGTADTALAAIEKVSASSGALEAAQSVLVSNWLILIVIGIGALAYFKGPKIMQSIRDYRTEDARTGANVKR